MLPNDPNKSHVNNLDLTNAVPLFLGTINYDGICRCHRCRIATLSPMLDVAFGRRDQKGIDAEKTIGPHAVVNFLIESRARIDGMTNAFRGN